MSKRALLDACADVSVTCSDGTVIRCCRFQVSTQCKAIARLLEDCPNTPEIPIPGVDSDALRFALDLVHGIEQCDAMGLAAAVKAREGLRILDCDAFDGAIAAQIWSQLRNAPLAMFQDHVNDLLRDTHIRQEVLRRLVVLCPLWTDFKPLLGGVLGVDLSMAPFLLSTLAKVFPVSLLYAAVVNKLPAASLAAPDRLLALGSLHGVSTYMHPSEARDVMRILVARMPATCLPSRFINTMLRAMDTYEVVPAAAEAMSGSILSYYDSPSVSVLVSLQDKSITRRRLAKWLTVTINRPAGTLDASFLLWKVDDVEAKQARRADVRVLAYSRDYTQVAEVWYIFDALSPWMAKRLDACDRLLGDPEALQSMLRRKHYTIRLDLYYNRSSQIDDPMF